MVNQEFKELPDWEQMDVQLAVENSMRLRCVAARHEPVWNPGGRRCLIVT
jgi:hypothetical protein